MIRRTTRTFVGRCALALLSTLSIGALGQATRQVDVRQGTVVYVSGNDLVVKMEDDTIRHFEVPSDFKFTVDGKDVSVQDLKAGTKLTQVITTTTQEQKVTEVRTVDAKILEVSPPYLTIATGDMIRHIKVPEGTVFTIDGKDMRLADLKKDMRVKGTVVTTVPTTLVAQSSTVTGAKPVETPVLVGVLLFEEGKPDK